MPSRQLIRGGQRLRDHFGGPDPTMSEETDALIGEIRDLLERVESSLPHRVDAGAVSVLAKIPFKVLVFREMLIWRLAELGRTALQCFESDRIASAITLTRATVETSAALWFLCARVEAALKSGEIGDIDQCVMRLMFGNRVEPEMEKAINVLSFVDKVDRDVPGFRKNYERLSEFAHPNWAGTALLFSRPDPPNLGTDFGTQLRPDEGTRDVGIYSLTAALEFFESRYNHLSDIMPAFVSLCEGELKKQAEGGLEAT
jgi:hypothetical protein